MMVYTEPWVHQYKDWLFKVTEHCLKDFINQAELQESVNDAQDI